ncbi:FHA domain-containing protein [Coleofasciculus sp. F4-SAH-05]|uniref:FHA domain-containing protein n=1 Tax=Coleofasciculus sp. F4-SAH-05 TaxID=3069525 RepID=UPI003301F2FD
MRYEFYIEIDKKKTIELTKSKVIKIGRGKANTFNFISIDDQTISANHCMIAVKDKKNPCFWVWDLGSKNKTIVNGIRILDGLSDIEADKGSIVYHGDFILIGNCKIRFLISKAINQIDGTL